MTTWYNFKIKGVGLWDGHVGGAEVATFRRAVEESWKQRRMLLSSLSVCDLLNLARTPFYGLLT